MDAKPQIDAFSSEWLQDVRPEIVEKLRACSERIRIADEDLVYAQGAIQQCLWSVAGGEVRVHVALKEMEPILGHIHHPGAWLGESEPILGVR